MQPEMESPLPTTGDTWHIRARMPRQIRGFSNIPSHAWFREMALALAMHPFPADGSLNKPYFV